MIFSETQTNYTLKAAPLSSAEELLSGLWVVIAGTDRIPPHIALLFGGKYYSLTVKKVNLGAPPEKMMKALERRPTPTLFVKIKTGRLSSGYVSAELEKIFASCSTLGTGEYTCLTPMSRFFAKTYSGKYQHTELVFELLAHAEKDAIIENCKSLFIQHPAFKIEHSTLIELPKYSIHHVKDKIRSLI